jgi:hypothetical protein
MDEFQTRTLRSFAEEAGRGLRGLDASMWRGRIERRYRELEAAFEGLLAHGETGEALALAHALAEFLRISGRVATGRAWLDRSLANIAAARKGDAPDEKLRELVEQSRARSAVYDVITNGVPVTIEVDTR